MDVSVPPVILKEDVPISASPLIDWYIITECTFSLELVPFVSLIEPYTSQEVRVMLFCPSITSAGVTLTVSNQTLEGTIRVDSISSLNMTLSDESTFEGSIVIEENSSASTNVSDNVTVTIEKGSVWTLDADSEVSSLTNNGTINYNGHTLTINGEEYTK